MKPGTRVFPLCIMLCLLVQIAEAAAGKHALLIAIQDYSYEDRNDPLLPSLAGPLNDVEIVGEMLYKRFGFQPEEITLLLDKEATHTGIESAFSELAERVKSGDFVYIHYSGHGSQTPDLNNDEPSGKDQTWLTYGARKDNSEEKNNYDVLDDEINAWLAAIYQKTDQVVFVSDSCHSATVSRGKAAAIRAVKEDVRPNPLGKSSYLQLKGEQHPGIRIGAARDRESAIESQAEDGNIYGLFTWYWVRALQHARDGETWNEVFQRVYASVSAGRDNMQQPQIWGESRGLEIVAGFTPQKPTVPVTKVYGDMVTIQAGALSGVTPESVYRLYVPDHPEVQDLPLLTITEVNPFVSSAKADGTFHISDLVIEERHAYHFPPIMVYPDADYPDGKDKPLLQALRSVFEDYPGKQRATPRAYALTDDPQQADIHLYILRPKCPNGQCEYEHAADALPKPFPDQPPEVWVLSPEHRLIYANFYIPLSDENPQQGIKDLQEGLTKLARIRELKALNSPGAMPAVMIDVHPIAFCQEERPDCIPVPGGRKVYHKDKPFRFQEFREHSRKVSRNERFAFTLRNESREDYYCYLLDIMPDGEVAALFPNPQKQAEEALVRAGESRGLIREFAFVASLPGEETLKFIVSSQPIDVSLLEIKGFQQQRGAYKKYANPLERLLLQAVYGQRGLTLSRNDEWATEQVSFDVQE